MDPLSFASIINADDIFSSLLFVLLHVATERRTEQTDNGDKAVEIYYSENSDCIIKRNVAHIPLVWRFITIRLFGWGPVQASFAIFEPSFERRSARWAEWTKKNNSCGENDGSHDFSHWRSIADKKVFSYHHSHNYMKIRRNTHSFCWLNEGTILYYFGFLHLRIGEVASGMSTYHT